MGLTLTNNSWLLDEEITSPEYEKTLRTAGTYLDRDIAIELHVQPGGIEYTHDAEMEQHIHLTDSGVYEVRASIEATITPNVTPGWISGAEAMQFSAMHAIFLNQTEITNGMIPDSSTVTGTSNYRVTATEGYNGIDLHHNIPIYQGDLTTVFEEK